MQANTSVTMAETGTGVATCPISNMYLSSGSCRVPDFLRAGVTRFGIGVDGAASSNSANMMEEIRVSYLLNRLSWGDSSANAEDVLYLATAGGATYWAGNARLAAAMGCPVGGAADDGLTHVYFGRGSEQLARFDVGDRIKPHSAEAVGRLREMGRRVVLMTGDNETAARAVAREAGIDEVRADLLPTDKADAVRALQAGGHVVAMAGDGINDAPALAAADISVAMGRGTDIARSVAQLTLMTSDLRLLPRAIRLSERTVGTIRRNLFWACVYNAVGIPLAAGALFPVWGVMLTPGVSAACMAFSSVSVVTSSLLLARCRI